MELLGCPYPIVKTPLGLLPTVYDIQAVKADLMQLLLTNPGERVMMPDFGTPLRNLLFEQNDPTIYDKIRSVIIASVAQWEPRIVVTEVEVTDDKNQSGAIAELNNANSNSVYVMINFYLPNKIQASERLVLKLPTGE
jgi:phage baseplate assembly protein W